ncbi:hypothetical protein SAMN05519103_09117 [Rhizobiales bacterium GAS113]|nr:hypothetical protein SAMN05519103_09117 [Rhizobiales bacterium GAS113]
MPSPTFEYSSLVGIRLAVDVAHLQVNQLLHGARFGARFRPAWALGGTPQAYGFGTMKVRPVELRLLVKCRVVEPFTPDSGHGQRNLTVTSTCAG